MKTIQYNVRIFVVVNEKLLNHRQKCRAVTGMKMKYGREIVRGVDLVGDIVCLDYIILIEWNISFIKILFVSHRAMA